MRSFFVGMLPFFLGACAFALQPEELLMKSLSYHGGLAAMEAQQQLAFSKKTISYDSLGGRSQNCTSSFSMILKQGNVGSNGKMV